MQEISIEYWKLDVIDQKVLRWMIKNTPASAPCWIEYTVKSYRSKGISINPQILLQEVIDIGLSEVNASSAKLTLQD